MSSIAATLAQATERLQAGDRAAAEQLFRQIVEQQPDHHVALHMLGIMTQEAGRGAEAATYFERAATLEPANPIYHSNLSAAYSSLSRLDDARAALQTAIALKNDFGDAWYNLGVVLQRQGRLDESEAAYRRAVALNTANPTPRSNLGSLLREQGRLDEALIEFEAALAADPENASAHYNRSLVWLSRGQLAEGFAEYEWRWKCREFNLRLPKQPRWQGQPLSSERLLVWCEQGLGDTLQFIRFWPAVQQRCPSAILQVPTALLPLLQQSGYTNLVPQSAALPAFDVQIPLISLCHLLGTTLPGIPPAVPYVSAQPNLVAHWRQRLSRLTGLKVGIAWQGNPTYPEDRYRSIPLPFFAPLAQVPGVQLISLQKGPGVEQIGQLRGAFHVLDLSQGLDTLTGPFNDTAAVMRALDLVITSDTAIAHLAGALGVNAWVALPRGTDWRWLQDRADSPWYPTMTLFRQQTLGLWPQVFADMALKLKALARG